MELNHTVSVLITSERFLITDLNKNDNILVHCTEWTCDSHLGEYCIGTAGNKGGTGK
jgi:hypothetical protein